MRHTGSLTRCTGQDPRLHSETTSTPTPNIMSTPWILHRLYTLDTSSSDFLRGLYSLIRHDEKEQYLISLQGLELTRLVDFLDKVRTVSSFFQISSVREILYRSSVPSLQPTMSDENVYTSCKQSAVTTRPYHPRTSYLVKSPEWVMAQSLLVAQPMHGKASVMVRESPSSVGEFLRTATRPPRSVCGPACLYHVHSMTPVVTAVILQECHHVEKVKASKHCPLRRRYDRSPANCLRVDAEWNPDGVRRGKSRNQSDWLGGSVCNYP